MGCCCRGLYLIAAGGRGAGWIADVFRIDSPGTLSFWPADTGAELRFRTAERIDLGQRRDMRVYNCAPATQKMSSIQRSTLNSQLSTLNSQLSTLNSQLSTLNSQLSTTTSGGGWPGRAGQVAAATRCFLHVVPCAEDRVGVAGFGFCW